MPFLRCVVAEWALVRPRLFRTRLGPGLLLLGAVSVWLADREGGPDPTAVALHAGALGAVLGAAFAAGGEADRAALAVTLSHPTTPLAIAGGRWLAACLPAWTLAALCAVAAGGDAQAAIAGFAAAGAVGGCALAGVLALGNGAALALFVGMAVAGAVPPERLVSLAEPGVLRVASATILELGPALWRYREIARGESGALIHAAAWAGLGVLLASGLIGRLACRRR